MSIQRAKCVGVVDGGMLILEGGKTVTLAGVRVPRVGVPGGSAMRTVLQRQVQDQEIVFEELGRDPMGYQSVSASADEQDLATLMKQALVEYGYGS